jgi:arginine N-succinyltransferase
VRFLYIARHRTRFERTLIAEMLAPATPDHGNRFWDYYGGLVTGLSYRDADRLSMHDKEFIRTLFPDSPLYTFLLPEDVLQSLGQVADSSRGAAHLLQQAGMNFLRQIDPFDAGPYYGAQIEDLVPVKDFRAVKAVAGEPDAAGARLYLVAQEGLKGFRAMQAQATVAERHVVISSDVLKALSVREGERLDVVPLP